MERLVLRFVAGFLVLCFSAVSVANRLPNAGTIFSCQPIVSAKAEVTSKNIVQLVLEEKEGKKESEKQFFGLAILFTTSLKPEILTAGCEHLTAFSNNFSFPCPRYLYNCSLLI